MPESFKTWLERLKFNWFPAYRGTGARLTHIAADWRTVKLRLPLNWRTRNIHGTIYGGSMYAAVDPIHAVMLIRNLGPDYTVWLKSAAVRFLKPGRSTLFAECRIDESELATIRRQIAETGKCTRVYPVPLVDAAGEVHASIDTIVHIAGPIDPQAQPQPTILAVGKKPFDPEAEDDEDLSDGA